jgi:hypothetical protein
MGIGTPDTSTYFGKVLHLAAGSNVGIMFNRTSSTAAKWSVGCNSGGSLVSAKEGVAQFEITADGRGLSQFTAKAWCNMNQSGTQAIQDSHNISSIQDDGTGLTRFTFTNNMGNVNYAGSLCSNWNAAQGLENTSVSYVESAIGALSGGYVDKDDVTLIIFGD